MSCWQAGKIPGTSVDHIVTLSVVCSFKEELPIVEILALLLPQDFRLDFAIYENKKALLKPAGLWGQFRIIRFKALQHLLQQDL